MNDNVSPRSHLATFVLSLLLFCTGFGGLHRLYTGHLISGLIQMLTGGGFFVWQIIDIIRICSGSFEDGEGRLVERD